MKTNGNLVANRLHSLQVKNAQLVHNELILRRAYMERLLDPPSRDINRECGYPQFITPEMYRVMWDREGIAQRVVGVYPEECWAQEPEIYDEEAHQKTPFEEEWKALDQRHHLLHFMQRADILSGIGNYGILFFGLDDVEANEDFSQEVEGCDFDDEGMFVNTGGTHKLLFVRAFDMLSAAIAAVEMDTTSPRYGLPLYYNLRFENILSEEMPRAEAIDTKNYRVHWTRCLHVADNRATSEIFGTPRQRPVWNYLLNIRKLLGASPEMFWKGGFPGLAFETNPEFAATADFDPVSMKQEMDDYQDSLKRYLFLKGTTAKQLGAEVADPQNHFQMQLQAVAITTGIPMRLLQGSEEAKLASSQDKGTWNTRLKKRQESYITPQIVRPFVQRLIAYGVLPPVPDVKVNWPDLSAPGDAEVAQIAGVETTALAAYVAGGVHQLIPPLEYLTHILKMPDEQAEAIIKAATDQVKESEPLLPLPPDPNDPENSANQGPQGSDTGPQSKPGDKAAPDDSKPPTGQLDHKIAVKTGSTSVTVTPQQKKPDKPIKNKKKPVANHIVKLKSGKYRLKSKKTGKNLGTFDSLAAAKKHEGQVEYFKHHKG